MCVSSWGEELRDRCTEDAYLCVERDSGGRCWEQEVYHKWPSIFQFKIFPCKMMQLQILLVVTLCLNGLKRMQAPFLK